MNKLNTQKRAQILGMMVEGNSLRSTSRMADVSINTVTKLLVDAGCAAADYHNKHVRNLTCKKVQCDEIWSFCYAKQKNVKTAKAAPQGAGDVWTWTAIDADTKLLASWLVADRSVQSAVALMHDLKARVNTRMQITTDGLKAYAIAVEGIFAEDVHFAQLVKIYGNAPGGNSEQKRYSPAECIGCKKQTVTGNPDPSAVSTSFVERQNLTMRMSMRRFTRLTNGFSKKFENHAHAVALHTLYYNFGRIHKTLRVTPAMAAGISDHVWSLEEIATLVG
jgi:IS1 family transposase